MKSLDIVLENSKKKGNHENKEILRKIVNELLSQIPDSSSNISDETGCRWIEVKDKEQHICCLLHCYYKIAFILDKLNIKFEEIYCVNVNSFYAKEWYINDVEELNRKFAYLHWDEPKEVVDPNKFNLLDMEFVTE